MSDVRKAIETACEEKSLKDALSWIAIWEVDRVVRSLEARGKYETTFGFLFSRVIAKYKEKHIIEKKIR